MYRRARRAQLARLATVPDRYRGSGRVGVCELPVRADARIAGKRRRIRGGALPSAMEKGGRAVCMHCSQMCDKCKPAERRAFVCGSCGKATILSRGDCLYALGYWKAAKPEGERASGDEGTRRFSCRHCGASLADAVREAVRPLPCRYSGIVCAYPCRRRDRSRGAADAPCRKQVLAKNPERAG